MPEDTKDYVHSGLDIQYAMLDRVKRFPTKPPITIRWGLYEIRTADSIQVPDSGIIKGEFISVNDEIEQGFDFDINGYFELENGQSVSRLRTWYDHRLPRVVEYPFYSKDGLIWVWNVYKRKCAEGSAIEEKWTGNAGFWTENVSETERIYHCSNGPVAPPDFQSLVFKVTILPLVGK